MSLIDPLGSFVEPSHAVDDAIDLAHLFALEHNVRLVEPSRVVLALSGEPQKPASRQRLEALLAAGATHRPAATKTDIYSLLDRQARAPALLREIRERLSSLVRYFLCQRTSPSDIWADPRPR